MDSRYTAVLKRLDNGNVVASCPEAGRMAVGPDEDAALETLREQVADRFYNGPYASDGRLPGYEFNVIRADD